MGKQVRTTGLPFDQAEVGNDLKHLRVRKIRDICRGCPMENTCQDTAPEGGPWVVIESSHEQAVDCRVLPGTTMVPVKARKVKSKSEAPPRPAKKDRWVIVLDANVFIEGAKGRFPGVKTSLLNPPPGVEFWVPQAVEDEVKFTKDNDRDAWFTFVKTIPDPPVVNPIIVETWGKGFTKPSRADALVFQLAVDYPEVDRIVSEDKFHGGSGLLASLGILNRVYTMHPRDLQTFVRRHRE